MAKPTLSAVLVLVLLPAAALAQDGPRAHGARREHVDSASEGALQAASIATSIDAADAIQRTVEIDAARRLAPFDLEWGTP